MRISARPDWLCRAPLLTALGLVLTAALGPVAASPTDGTPARFAHAALHIQTHRGMRNFDVQLALTADEQELGLMWVRILPVDQGMIFPMDPPRVATFWMKNTYVPLDMLFIDRHGRIACIHTAVPLTLDNVSCPAVASAVLEIAGGQAADQHIQVGDQVRWSPEAPTQSGR